MPIYTSTGAFNVAVNDTTGKGRYSASGALRINLVTGSSYVGLYAADGALNVVDVSGVSISTYGGLYHPSGAIRGRTAPTTYSGVQAPDGSYYFLGLFSPLNLFSNSEQGAWYDPSDFSTMFQDSAGTIPVTAVEQPVGLIRDKSGRGNHASQSTAAARPMLRQEAGGQYYLDFDGTDDTLVGPAIGNVISASAYETCVGARFNAVTTNNASSWLNQSLVTDSAGYVGIGMARSTGVVGAFNYDATQDEITVAMTPPATIVLQQRHSGGSLAVSTNGGAEVSTASGNTAALTGALQLLKAFGAVYTNGRLYAVVIRNSVFTSAERASLLAWVNGKTGAY